MRTARHRPARSSRRFAVALALPATTMVATSCLEPPDDLAVSVVIADQNRPWDLAFTPDGTMLYTEKNGNINALLGGARQIMDANGATAGTTATGFLQVGEGGMMGLAIDPLFASNRHIYTCFLTGAGGVPADVRVVRWTVNAGHTALTDRVDIVTGLPAASTGRHSGCRPRFGPDGFLWIGTGDAAVGTNPQSPTSLGGKVLRVDRNGNGAPDNPGAPLDPRIYTYGHRNVQGIAFSPSGRAYSIEHGTNCDDEINVLQPGGNYGWDPIPGYNEARPMTDLVKFPNAVPALWASGCPTIAPSGGAVLSGDQWSGWEGGLAVAVLKDQHLHVLRFGQPSGDPLTTLGEWEDMTGFGRLRSAVQGPDGALYVSQDANPGNIYRVEPVDLPD
jgi:glucose/arabinose dehydrogenase